MKKTILILSFLASQLLADKCTEEQYKPYFTDNQEIRYMYSYSKTTDNSEVVIDKKSIIYDKKNQKIKCWTISQLLDYPAYGIWKIQWEFNLKNNKVRVLNATSYNCSGEPINSTSIDNWNDIIPNSGNEYTLNDLIGYLKIK